MAGIIEVMPLWKLQTIGRDRLDFLYPNVGKGQTHSRLSSRRRSYCLRRFRDLIGDMAEIGVGPFRVGCTALATLRELLARAAALRGSDPRPGVDHFVPWARYPLDLGHNYVLADARCNGFKSDRLAAFEHLDRWCARNGGGAWTAALDGRLLPHDSARTKRGRLATRRRSGHDRPSGRRAGTDSSHSTALT